MKRSIIVGAALCLRATSATSAASVDHEQGRESAPNGSARSEIAWSGFYLGGHTGQAWGHGDWSARAGGTGQSSSGAFDFYQAYDPFKGTGSFFTGLQGGYNYRLPSGILIGVETDASFPNTLSSDQIRTSAAVGAFRFQDRVKFSGTVRGRLGYTYQNWLFYATGGYAWASEDITRIQVGGGAPGQMTVIGDSETKVGFRNGWTIGAGVELALSTSWTANLQYLRSDYGVRNDTFVGRGQHLRSELTTQDVRLGLNYLYGGANPGEKASIVPASTGAENWAVHGQSTFVYQYAFPFAAPYRGQNSLDSGAGRETVDVTLYAGVKPWRGAEIWVNPEIDQGFGLSGTLGLAGFASGEAYKIGANDPYAKLQRLFLRQTFNLGGEEEKVEAAANQFATTQTKDRVVFTIGKFAVTDIFDANKYAHDPRGDFLNWALIDTATFDYAADAWGYTYGSAVEWYTGDWTVRGGFFDLSIVPNSTELDPSFKQFQLIGELERRYAVLGQPGKLAVTAFLTEARQAKFTDAVRLSAITGQAADVSLVRRYRAGAGVSLNLEQQVSKDVGLFARAGWRDGGVEPYEFTDVDTTIAGGVVINGTSWGRPKDTLGIAGVINGISSGHEAYLNAGGLGILVGDGKLPNPGLEKILEFSYSFPVSSLRATLDYQFIDTPAYNGDRGPVSIIGTRLHTQF